MSPSPLGETLRRARTSRQISLEDAERVTRIPRKYLEALELENFGILPAPVYARGFLRSYASYLGLEPNELLPFFPVGHVDEPTLDPLPEMDEPRTWNMNSIVAIGVVGMLLLLVVALYTIGRDDSNASFANRGADSGDTITVPEGNGGGDAGVTANLPDLLGQTEQAATAIVEEAGATALIVRQAQGDVPEGQVIAQNPEEGAEIGPGDLVTLTVAAPASQ